MPTTIRRLAVAAMAAAMLLQVSPAQADSGWVRHHAGWVRYSFTFRNPQHLQGGPLAALYASQLDDAAHQARMDHDAYADHLRRLLARARAILAEARSTISVPIGIRGSCTSGPVHDYILATFGSAGGSALSIASRESGCSPGARNPSGASGVFQLMPFWWDGSSSFHWRFNPFDYRANVYHARLIYDYQGGWCPAWC